jgi:predicted dienelactone hydrolase
MYQVGVRIMELTDESRDDRTLETYIWYPALVSDDAPRPFPPDTSGAPYPLVIFSHGYTGSPGDASPLFVEHLVSQGFVVAGVDHRDSDPGSIWPPIHQLIDRPLDVLFLLDQLAELKNDDALDGMIDTDNIGMIGYSFGAYTALAVGGARLDHTHLADWCSTNSSNAFANYCAMLPVWEDVRAYREAVVGPSDDDLWSASGLRPIRATMVLAPCFGQLFGERGLEQVYGPVLMVAGTADETCPYEVDAAYIHEHLINADHYLVSLNERTHSSLLDPSIIQQYAAAFFGYYLQQKSDYYQHLQPESADAFRDVTLERQLISP